MTNTILSKIKYLYITSLQIIREFGIKYYLTFGIVQLKKQKLSLFLPNENNLYEFQSTAIVNKKEQYFIWKEEQRKKLEIDIVKNNFQILPKITIILNSSESMNVFSKSIGVILPFLSVSQA